MALGGGAESIHAKPHAIHALHHTGNMLGGRGREYSCNAASIEVDRAVGDIVVINDSSSSLYGKRLKIYRDDRDGSPYRLAHLDGRTLTGWYNETMVTYTRWMPAEVEKVQGISAFVYWN